MKTELSNSNPFGYSRKGYAFEKIKQYLHQTLSDKILLLDVGCYDGNFIHETLKNLKNDNSVSLYAVGIDVNEEVIRNSPFKDFLVVYDGKTLPFKDNAFEIVTLLDVLEHLSYKEQMQLLTEIYRVLKENGIFVITVPKKHIFSFLDLGNLKFVFPSLHRYYIYAKYGRKHYFEKYQNNPYGLFGDISKEKMWHQHFSKKGLKLLLHKKNFLVKEFDGSGLLLRVFILLSLLFGKLPLVNTLLTKLSLLDARLFSQANLFCTAEKIPRVNVVFFDFDKTLTTRDTLLPFAFHVCRKTKRLASFLTLIFCYVLLRLKLISNKDFKNLFLKFVINGITQEDLKDIVSDFENSFIKKHLKGYLFDKFKGYMESGCKVVIVSSNFDILLKNLSMLNGALIISTQTDCKDKKYSIEGNVCAGTEKVKRIEAMFGKRIFEEAIFYGDKEDKILLRTFKISIEV